MDVNETTILVTGAGGGQQGSTGTHVATQLLGRRVSVRVLVHHLSAQSEQLASLGSEVVQGDLLDIVSVRAALAGIRRVYFAYPVQEGLVDATAILASVAREAHVEMVLNLSQGNAGDPTAPSPRTRQHWLSENVFDWADIGAIHLRASVFFENIRRQTANGVRNKGRFVMPLGKAENTIPLIAAEDVARAAVAILVGPNRTPGERVQLVGQILTPNEMVATLSRILGHSIAYESISDQAWREQAVEREGPGNPLQIEHLSKLWLTLRSANERGIRFDNQLTRELVALMGAVPMTFADFVQRNRAAFGRET